MRVVKSRYLTNINKMSEKDKRHTPSVFATTLPWEEAVSSEPKTLNTIP
jgi:hypothetical protein